MIHMRLRRWYPRRNDRRTFITSTSVRSRGCEGRKMKVRSKWHGYRSYFTVRLYCTLNDLFHTRALPIAMCYTDRFVRSNTLCIVEVARKRRNRDGTEGERNAGYSRLPITRCYTLPIIGFTPTKFANFIPHYKTRVFPLTRELGVSACAYSRSFRARRPFYARIVIANSLSSIVIADTSERLDENDFSRAAIDR